jgi:DNA-binding NarL/FixJ family response regulator
VLLLQQVKKNPQPPSELVPDMPINLERAILKALAKLPDARFETAGAMAAALAAAVPKSGQTINADAVPFEVMMSEPEEPPPAPAPSRVIRVALADDHRILRTSLAMFLNDNDGIEVVGEADDGQQALEIAREHRPDVLLLDLNMPGVSGLDILPQLRATCPDTKVLVLTGRDEDAYIVRALRAGAHGYILKTIDEADLLQAVIDVRNGHLVLGHGVAERVVQGLMARNDGRANDLGDLERTILIGIAAGLTNDQIAERLRIDPQLVAAQLVVLIEQLNAKSRSEAALIALRQGLITLEDLHNF